MNDNGGCAPFALLLLAVSFPFAVKRPIEPGSYVFGALIYGATAIWLGIWLNSVATETERKKRISRVAQLASSCVPKALETWSSRGIQDER